MFRVVFILYLLIFSILGLGVYSCFGVFRYVFGWGVGFFCFFRVVGGFFEWEEGFTF